MKILRTSRFLDPVRPPLTTVLRECDLTVPIDEARAAQDHLPGAFIVTHVFDLAGEPSIAEATRAATCYIRPQVEQDMAILYHYDATSLVRCTAGGVLTATRPAPLSAEDITEVFRQLRLHPSYKQQHVIAISRDFQIVTLDTAGIRSIEGKRL